MPHFQATFTLFRNLVSEQGIQPLPDKIVAITNLAKHKNVAEVHLFLGLTSYIEDSYHYLLNKLLRKDTEFQWSIQCQLAFNHLKNALCKKPILQYPNVKKPYTQCLFWHSHSCS